MRAFLLCFEWIGVAAFALSGALTGLRKQLDVFGVCILGLTTAVGGGILRDLILGITPPNAFRDPVSAALAIGVSVAVFIPATRRFFFSHRTAYDRILLIADSAGLAVFTVSGIRISVDAGFGDEPFLTVFVGVLTGVGGGILRDLFAGDRPQIFVKHIYACASLAGAVVSVAIWNVIGQNLSMLVGFSLIFLIRICAAHFRWSLPKAQWFDESPSETRRSSRHDEEKDPVIK